ncbi:MAG: hypothetical protein P8Y21_13775 [Gemmatimonadales bacterium]
MTLPRFVFVLTAGAVSLFGCSSDGGNGTGPPANQSPTARITISGSPIPAGNPDLNVVALDGSASSDPDGTIAGYTWSAGTCAFVNGTDANSQIAQVLCDGSADVPVNLTVTDDDGATGNAADLIAVEAAPVSVDFKNLIADPMLPASAFNVGTLMSPPDFIPANLVGGYEPTDVSALNNGAGLVMPTDGRTLQSTDYYGAVEPGTALTDAWYYGWTIWETDGSDSRPDDNTCAVRTVVTGTITDDTTWGSGTCWVLDGPVFVGEDCGPDPAAPDAGCDAAVLTIEPGTTIYGLKPPSDPTARSSFLVIRRGSQIMADATGSERRPTDAEMIVMTSTAAPGTRARGDWGGLVINGRAPINSGDEAVGEGDSGIFGGVDDEDSSGIIRGVRVEFAGDDLTASDQLNGIAFQGSGSGTTASWIQVAYNKDDGTEPFGGSTSQTYMVTTGIGDDSFDGTDGYRGFLQFLIAQQRADDADQGFELSNNGDDGAATPKSTAVVANATMVGAGNSGQIANLGGESDIGLLHREGSNWRIFNTIITNFGDSGFCIEGSVAVSNADNRLAGQTAPTSTLSTESSIIWNNGPGGSDNFADACGSGYDNEAFWTAGE